MNQRILIRQIGCKSTMKIRDYIGFNLDPDRVKDIKLFEGLLDAKKGDHIFIISLKPPKLKRKRRIE